MRLIRFHIDGFGHFHAAASPELGAGLNLFVGPNEAGKSTLMAFLRALFYGFEAGRGKGNDYPPLAGGRHGGWAEVLTAEGRYRIERTEGGARGRLRVQTQHGGEGDQALLDRLLGHTGKNLYQTIFSFGLDELHELEALQGPEVAGQIYAAGLAGGRAWLAAEKHLEAELKQLLMGRGKGGRINALAAALDAAEQKLAESRRRASQYEALQRERDAALAEAEDLGSQLERASAAWRHNERLREAWPIWASWREAQERLASVQHAQHVPPDCWTRWQYLTASLAEREDERAQAQANATQHGQQAAPWTAERLLEHEDALLQMVEEAAATRQRLQELPRAEASAEEARCAWQRACEALGAGWDQARVQSFAGIAAQLADVRNWQSKLAQAEEEWAQAQQPLPTPPSRPALGTLLAVLLAAALLGLGLGRASWPLTLAAGLAVVALLLYQRQSTQAPLVAEALAARQKAEARRQELRHGWQQWLAARGLPTETRPEGAFELLRAIAGVQEAWATFSEREAARSRLERQSEAFLQRVSGLAEQLQLPLTVAAGDPEAQAKALTYLERAQKALEHAREQQRAELAAEVLTRRCDELRQQRSELLASVGAHDEASLRALAEAAEDFRTTAPLVAERERTLRQMAGSAGFDPFVSALAAIDGDRLERESARAAATHGKLQEAYQRAVTRGGELNERLRQLEEAADTETAAQERNAAREALAQAAMAWAERALALDLLRRARGAYERERQPQVLKRAAELFAEATEGRYPQLYAPLGEATLRVVRADGALLEPAQLSRGTGEALYLSMRLALCLAHGQQAVSLPLIVDDALVNLDAERLAQAARILAMAATELQILLFTCHDHVRQAVLAAAPETPTIRLQDGRLETA